LFREPICAVTGGASGLGAALARELVGKGAQVVIADLDLPKAERVASSLGPNAHAEMVDVSVETQVSALAEKVRAEFGKVDFFFNNAGTSTYGETSDLPFSEWERVLRVNLMGVIAGSRAAYKIMREQGSGHIINIGSASVFTVDPLFGPYVTSKFGVVGFSRVLAIEAEVHNVNVSVVCPGNIRTPLLDQKEPSWLTPPISAQKAAQKILAGVARRRNIIVFPFRWRLLWWADRVHPGLLNPLRRIIARRGLSRKRSTP
jgi:NAD(P)-dependent dehydrogenase (short-subunit alcohol dehydrogenase family)